MVPHRRSVLHAGTTLAAVATAGCFGSLADTGGGVPICEVSVTNSGGDGRVVDLRLHDDGVTIFEDTLELRSNDADGVTHAAITAEDLVGSGEATRLEARASGGEWAEVALDSLYGGVVQVNVGDDPDDIEFVDPVGDEAECPH